MKNVSDLEKLEKFLVGKTSNKECTIIEFYENKYRMFCSENSQEINYFKKAIKGIYQISNKISEISSVRTPKIGDKFNVEIYKGTGISTVGVISVGEESFSGNNGNSIRYDEIKNCWFCYFLKAKIKELNSENECCFRFFLEKNNQEIVICSREKFSCEANMKMILKKIYYSCKEKKNIIGVLPKICGFNQNCLVKIIRKL